MGWGISQGLGGVLRILVFILEAVEKHWSLRSKEEIEPYFQFEKITHCSVWMDWREIRIDEDRSRVKGRDDGSFKLG